MQGLQFFGRVQCLDELFDRHDGGVWSGSASGETYCSGIGEPGLAEICDLFDLIHLVATSPTGLHEFTGIVTMASAYNDDDIALGREGGGGRLTLFGGLADGILEPDLGTGETFSNLLNEGSYFLYGLSGLSDNSQFRVRLHLGEVVLCQDYVEGFEVSGHPLDFDMIPFPDDDWMEALPYKFLE